MAALPTTAGHAFPAAGARLALPVWTQYCLSRKLMTSLGLTEPVPASCADFARILVRPEYAGLYVRVTNFLSNVSLLFHET